MNPELRGQYHAVRKILSTTTASDLRARYRVGVVVLEVKRSEDRYGTRAVALLGAALSRSETTLYRYSAVAEAWTETEVEEILLKKLPGGEPVSWCHLQEIAAAPQERREALLKDAFAKGLSLRELTALARGERPETSPPAEPGAVRPLMRLKQLATACESIERFAIDEALLEGILSANPDQAGEIVGRALAAQSKAMRLLERNMIQLRKAAAMLPHAPVPKGPSASADRAFFPRLLSGGAK
jgi:hypothetical protein